MVIIPGRPDFGTRRFGVTQVKKFPRYAYSLAGNAALMHKLIAVNLYWYVAKGDHLVRLDTPRMIGDSVCGRSFFLHGDGKRALTCELPGPDTMLCGCCHGEGARFEKKGNAKMTQKEAHMLLGCVASAD